MMMVSDVEKDAKRDVVTQLERESDVDQIA